MFIVDNILLSPMKGFMWIVRELHNAAQQEIKSEGEQLTHRLSTLYMMLETGQITSEEFDVQEGEILSRLDEIELAKGTGAESDEGDDEDGGEEADQDGQDEDDQDGDDQGEDDDRREAGGPDDSAGQALSDGGANEPLDGVGEG